MRCCARFVVFGALAASAAVLLRLFVSDENPDGVRVFEVWGVAALSTFLWESVLDAGVPELGDGGSWLYGSAVVGRRVFRFRSGPAVSRGRVPDDAENVILVLNGRVGSKVAEAESWLDRAEQLTRLRFLAVVLLGSEQCENAWVLPRMRRNGGKVDRLFVVYDAAEVNGDDVRQWPLGTATYRGFPTRCYEHDDDLDRDRRYSFNFFGTLHPEVGSRLALGRVLTADAVRRHGGVVGFRPAWTDAETPDSLLAHVTALLNSDLTLCPGGLNAETYRVYEALTCGSVPVLVREESGGGGNCGGGALRLLREHGLPAVFLDSWDELPAFLDAERAMSGADRAARRKKAASWYRGFLRAMRDELLSVLP